MPQEHGLSGETKVSLCDFCFGSCPPCRNLRRSECVKLLPLWQGFFGGDLGNRWRDKTSITLRLVFRRPSALVLLCPLQSVAHKLRLFRLRLGELLDGLGSLAVADDGGAADTMLLSKGSRGVEPC